LGIKIDVFPDPASELVTVNFDSVSGQTRVNLINNLGIVLMEKEFYINGNSHKVDFDIAGLQSGVYLLGVVCENIYEIRKVIVF